MRKSTPHKPRKMGKKRVAAATKLYYELWGWKQGCLEEDAAEAERKRKQTEEFWREALSDGDEVPDLLFDELNPLVEKEAPPWDERPMGEIATREAFYKLASTEDYEKWNKYLADETRWFNLWLASSSERCDMVRHEWEKAKQLRKKLEEQVLMT